jgi:PAS domain S-box-containing protein
MSVSPKNMQHVRSGPFDMAKLAVVSLDAESRVTGWSQAATEVLGYPATEALGRPVAALLSLPEEAAAALTPGGDGPDRWSGLVAARHRDGHRLELGLGICRTSELAGTERRLLLAIDVGRTPWWGVSHSVLERFLTRSPFGMAVLSTDLRYVWINETLERMAGVPLEERLGRRPSEVLPGLDTVAMEAQMRRVLETGAPVLAFEYTGYVPADPKREHVYSTSFFPLDDADGRLLGVCYMGIDVTDRRRAKERLALLTEAGERIGSSLDIIRTAQDLADTAVPRLADFVTVDLLDSVLLGEEPDPGPVGGSPPLHRVAQQSTREGCPEAAVDIGEPSGFPPTSPPVRCLVDGEALLEPTLDSTTATWVWGAVRAEKIREFALHSLMVVPVQARGVSLGVALFIRWRRPEPFEEDDLRLAAEFVSRAAVCLDNARRYTREHTAALTLQRTLLPHALPAHTTLEFASRYLPADARSGVGGDWFDVIPLSGARVALVVGDVVGRGINAAATMGRLRTAVHTLADMDLPPDELLAHLDDLTVRLADVQSPEGEAAATAVLGATCLYAVYDPVTRRCSMARAGHLPPATVDPQGNVSYIDLPPGPPLGLGYLPFESAELELPEGSLLALFSKGLIDTRTRDIDAGMARLGTALAYPDRTVDEVCDGVLSTMLTDPQSDDATLLLIRTRALGAHQVASWDLPTDPAVVADARALASRTLEEWGLAGLVFSTELMVSELVTNAIRYAVGPIRLRLIRESALICEVADASSTSPRMRHARTTDEGGRGLFIVAQLAGRWGTRYSTTGKIIWAEQEFPTDSSPLDALM